MIKQAITKPAMLNQHQRIGQILRWQLWLIPVLAVVCVLVKNVSVAQNTVAGASLAWLAQAVFAWFSFRYVGFQARKTIVQYFYRGQLLKWLVSMVGFTLLFIGLKPLMPAYVFIGYILMVFCHWWLVYYLLKTTSAG